jgi:hypothetical protein
MQQPAVVDEGNHKHDKKAENHSADLPALELGVGRAHQKNTHDTDHRQQKNQYEIVIFDFI